MTSNKSIFFAVDKADRCQSAPFFRLVRYTGADSPLNLRFHRAFVVFIDNRINFNTNVVACMPSQDSRSHPYPITFSKSAAWDCLETHAFTGLGRSETLLYSEKPDTQRIVNQIDNDATLSTGHQCAMGEFALQSRNHRHSFFYCYKVRCRVLWIVTSSSTLCSSRSVPYGWILFF